MKRLSIRHLLIVNMPLHLLLFLIRERELSTYLDDFIDQNGNLSVKNFLAIVEGCSAISCILSNSFVWGNTRYGHSYYNDLFNRALYFDYILSYN